MRVLIALVISALAVTGAGAAFLYSGLYDVAASDQHTAPVFWLLKTMMRRAVQHHGRAIDVPPLRDPALIARGRVLYQAQCARCHGAPGGAPERFALGLRPAPANLANTGIEWPASELFWTIKHGLKMTGMPAWEFRLRDDAIWAIVAYVQLMPYESPRAYRAELQAAEQSASARAGMREQADETVIGSVDRAAVGDVDRGRHVLQQYACITCHEIPGIVGASGPVGPPLDAMGTRAFIGGVLQNTPQNMVRWLRAPEQFVPDGAMPNLGVSERDARDMAAYLQSLR